MFEKYIKPVDENSEPVELEESTKTNQQIQKSDHLDMVESDSNMPTEGLGAQTDIDVDSSDNSEINHEINEQNRPTISFEYQTAAKLLETRKLMVRIPTGCKAFDKIIGGGIEPCSITEFYGAYTTGKTQMSMQLAFNTVLPTKLGGLGGYVVYIDSEGSFRPERITQMANERNVEPRIILDRILIGRAHNSDIQIKLVDDLLGLAEEKDIKLVIVDSLTSAFRAEYIGKGALMERQQKLNHHMRQLSKVADLLGIAVVVTNQVSSVIDGFENTVIPVGGNIIAHGSTHRVHFKKSPKRPQIRIANLVASPSYPDGTATFEITQAGIQDISFKSLVPSSEND